MPEIVRLQPEYPDDTSLPPAYFLKFTQEEFPGFLANPTGTMADLGHPVKNLVVTVKDHVWDSGKQEWFTDETDKMLFDLPPASQWQWVCGYQDEMCVCERVIVATLPG